jgi:hypothetical protein
MREHTGAAMAIAGILTTFFMVFAWMLVVLMWISLTIYALVKWIGSAPEAASATTVLLIVVGLATALTLAVAGAVALVGSSMTPKRRRRSEEMSGVGL